MADRTLTKRSDGLHWLSVQLTEWLHDSLESWQPSSADLVSAFRHFKDYEEKQLSSESNWERRIALGKLYEYAIYEKILNLAQDTELIKYVVRKGRDATQKVIPKTRLASNGLLYSKRGDICVRGNGQDLAEFDVLLVGSQEEIVLIEVLVTKMKLKDFASEYHYKSNLLRFLFGKWALDPIVVSFIDLPRKPVFIETVPHVENHFVHTRSIEGPLSAIRSAIMEGNSSERHRGKLIGFNELRPREFDYRSLHDQVRNQLTGAAFQLTQSVENLVQETHRSIVKNAIIGVLSKSAVAHLLGTKQMVLLSSRGPLSTEEFHRYFSRVLLVLSLPELRPTLYLRVRSRGNYLKMGPVALSAFKFERNIEAQHTEFFQWLEETDTNIETSFMQRILDYYLRKQIVGEHKKKPQFPKL